MKRMIPALALATMVGALLQAPTAGAQDPPPETGFEESNGASWTTHEEELAFLAEVDERADRVAIEVVGRSLEGRPVHLVRVGHPAPTSLEETLSRPTTIFVCTQHGNEPAGREACLIAIRDLAFTDDAGLVDLLSTQAFLFIPTANPDGRARSNRGNASGTDINRDHVGLRTPEGRAIARVIRDWKPDLAMDMHEYGPSQPVVYDDEILYLWPRNLNVEKGVQDLARSFAVDHIKPCSEAGGYTADEYGIRAVGDVDVQQTAGGPDEGIMRNAMGLRHTLGILIESAVSPEARNNVAEEVLDSAANNRRRVSSQRHVIGCTFDWLVGNGEVMRQVTATAPLRKQGEGLAQNVPVYFGGADNQAPDASDVVYPAPCAYDLGAAEAPLAADALSLHGIESVSDEDGSLRVPMGQQAEPMIPLLLDGRGDRNLVAGSPVDAAPLDPACRLPSDGGGTAGPIAAMAGGLALAGVGLRLRRR